MHELLGSAHAFASGKKGRAHAAVKNNGFLDGMNGLNSHFTDSGLFGIQVAGQGSHSADLLNVSLQALDGLRQPIDDVELARAKNTLKMNYLLSMESSADRLEEAARNYASHGSLTMNSHMQAIDDVTSAQINDAARRVMQGKPTMVVTGGNINLVPTMTDVQRQLN